ncbi:hypothetical protein [Phenylobacterium sp.]|uniref:hypothetical protein n=1 Tax=Phenylobacterium sp. TaxID=1871053 RepID=UPI0011F94FF8|nr:hypothetical protein [Phenylobacterium sp.]THD60570.1 MAG: hypothetical protein E8A49_14180 [Phenylobacterium sp.]
MDQAARLQTATAVVQAVCSIILLGWYVLAAHLERRRVRLEKADDFNALVRLCRDLGLEAKARTEAHLDDLKALGACEDLANLVAGWRSDMTIVYVCLNEVPHYEVRNPAFSTALTRLWLEVDCRTIAQDACDQESVADMMRRKLDRICREVDAMAALLSGPAAPCAHQRRLASGSQRRGYDYEPAGFVRGQAAPLGASAAASASA